MAFIRSGSTGSLRMLDRTGKSSTVTIPFPDQLSDGSPVTSAHIYGALVSWLPLIEALSGLVCVGMSVADNYYEDTNSPTSATTTSAQVGRFQFYNLLQQKTTISIPGFLETKLITTGTPHVDDLQIIDNEDADVAAFVTAMTSGYDTGAGVMLRPGIDANAYVTGLAASDFVYTASKRRSVARG